MPAPKRQLTAAELASLEHAFAADPSSEAYRALAEAYLAAGRFMEAMVVCKKGVKTHPDDPAPRVLLARVYADQGKDKKALEELSGVLATYPNYAVGNLLAATLHLRGGARAEGEAALRRAAEASPTDLEVLAALEKHGVSLAPPPPPPPAASPASGGPPVLGRPSSAGLAAASPRPSPTGTRPAASQPTPTPPPVPRAGDDYARQLAEKYGTQTWGLNAPGAAKPRKGASRTTLFATVGLAVVLVGSLVAWQLFARAHKQQVETIAGLLKETQELVGRDSFGAYRTAAEKAQAILKVDPGSLAGHAFLSYVDALRYLEHAEGDAVKAEAIVNLDAGRKLGNHSHLIAAEAYLKAATGDLPGGLAGLKAELEDPARQTGLLSGAMGVLLMTSGDLEAAREWLVRAQKLNPNEVRLAQQLAEQYRRRGEGYEQQAENAYQLALRLQKDHVPSLLGRALLLLERGLYDQAAQHVQLVLTGGDASPRQQALAYAVRGSVLFAQGKATEGTADEKKAIELDPQSPDLPWLIGRRQLRDGEAAAAVVSIQRAVNGDPRRVAFYVDLNRALLATPEGGKKAIEVLQKATTRAGDHPRIALLLGDAYRAQGDTDRARGQYERSIQLGKPYPDARVALARLHRQLKNVPAALAELDLAITEYGQGGAGSAAQAYLEMADIERARGSKSDLVFSLYVKALDKDPASCDGLWNAGKMGWEAARGRDEESQKARDTARLRLERYLQVCPRDLNVTAARVIVDAARK
jgi:tetratricopeptide (TPR) repeat protein